MNDLIRSPMNDLIGDLFGEAPEQSPEPKWPHKCRECGRFVSHEKMVSWHTHDDEYRATAVCAHCDGRTEALPI